MIHRGLTDLLTLERCSNPCYDKLERSFCVSIDKHSDSFSSVII